MQNVFEFSASDTWVVNHDYGYYPVTEVVILINGGYEKILPADLVMNSENQLTVTFTSAQEGYVRLR